MLDRADYEWRLRKHVLPFFADFRVSDITVALVDEYRNEKVVERERIRTLAEAGMPARDKRGQRRVALSNESINKTLVLLANVLDAAVEYELLPTNPARGKRRRLKAACPTRRFPSKPTSSARSSPPLRSWIMLLEAIIGSAAGRGSP
jgi:hypothetical protein